MPVSDTSPSLTPGVAQGPQNGPAAVTDPAYWDQVLGIQGTNGKVERVSFANMLGNPTLQALVTVRHSDANSTLDVYVFDKITNAKPAQLFKMSGLIKGDAKISYYNSVMTAEVDQLSPLNAGKSSGQWTQDLFREFAWNQGEGALTQVAFPGIFPDLTRYQAEADQSSVNHGHQPWRNDPAQVAKALSVQFLQWTRPLTATVTSGGDPHDVYATVEVQESNAGISNEPSTAVLVKVLLTTEPGVALGPLPGPDKLQQLAYWVPIIGVDTSKASVGTPSFANMKGNTSLQALVPVYHIDGSQIVDVYVYDQISSAYPVGISI
jgi:hypothetical protein